MATRVEELLEKHKNYVLHPETSGMSLQEAYELRGDLLRCMFVMFPLLHELAHGNCEITDKIARVISQTESDSVPMDKRMDGIIWLLEDTLKLWQIGCQEGTRSPLGMRLILSPEDGCDSEDW